MRSRAAAVALLAAGLGCAQAPTPASPAAHVEQPFTMRPGQTVAIAGTPVKITFEGVVFDNRCPVDVVCIVGGEARASFRVDAGRAGADTVVLDTDRNPSAVVSGYRVSLVSVSPAPRSNVRIDPRNYVVELTVSR